jgi:hypothetical protein
MKPSTAPIWLLGWVALGCAHTVVLDTEPHGAQVEIDGEIVGTTPVTYVDRAGFKRTYSINLSKPGFQPRSLLVTQQLKVPTVCCPLLILWAWELPEDSYTWALQHDTGTSAAPAPGFLPPDPKQAPPGWRPPQ